MDKNRFEGLIVSLASVEDISGWSRGAVDNADTVNYRTGKPKQSGLFCESIFGPIKNFECSCGKYKGLRYKGIVCDKCGVEVTTSRTRRTRMGHIELASPVVHARYKNSPSGGIHQLLGLSANEIDKILSFVKYIVLSPVSTDVKKKLQAQLQQDLDGKFAELDEIFTSEKKSEKDKKKLAELDRLYTENKESLEKEKMRLNGIIISLSQGMTISESDYRHFFSQFQGEVSMESGPEGLLKVLQSINIKQEIDKKIKGFSLIKSEEQKKKAMSLIKLLINLYVSNIKPENMILRKLPVIPPDLRPVVQLDGGRFAASDVNLFYRRVLMRNNRLKKMIQVGMPDVLKKNEIRLLQESVNNLLVGEKNPSSKAGSGIKIFKSLSDMLSGKEGIFRKNLLGKRVDYSGRSVITVGPDLKLNECGLPIYIAVKIFTPFIIGKLIDKKIVYTPKQAEKLIKDEDPIALKFLEEVIKDKYVLLNRAPTLHRLSIEAFKIKLYPGKTIRLHPLVCGSFNADFDGDQMAVHLPISDEAQKESRELIAADKNVLQPSSGEPTLSLSQDMVLGIYYLTDYFNSRYPEVNTTNEWSENLKPIARYTGKAEAFKAFENKEINVKDKIMILNNGDIVETTVGRVIFNLALPEGMDFINETIGNKSIKKLISKVFDEYDIATTVKMADAIKDLGFKYSTLAAVSINILDMKIPEEKKTILQKGDKQVDSVLKLYYKGFFSEAEKHRMIIDIWTNIKKEVEVALRPIITQGNDLFTMIDSGARGSQTHLTQICGMKGLVVNPQGEIIELPIKASFTEGLKPIEYFIAAHSGRKGKADTALRTAESGYLTRKLCDASQEVIVREEDCGTKEYLIISKDEAELKGEKFGSLIYGRILAEEVIDEKGNVLIHADEMINKQQVSLLETTNIPFIKVRSPITCHCSSGVCQKCYGMDLSNRKLVEVGVPVGIIAAQSIGEPSTQLTLNTFHSGGVAGGGGEIATGIDRIKQLFEVRPPKNPAIVAPFDGTIDFEETPEGGKFGMIKITSDIIEKEYPIPAGFTCKVKVGQELAKGATYASKKKIVATKLKAKTVVAAAKGESLKKVTEKGQVLAVKKNSIILGVQENFSKSLFGLLPKKNRPGEKVIKGEILTTGALNITEYKAIMGDLQAQRYIISEAKRVYAEQGQDLNDKHMEIVVKQLFSKVFIEDSGDSSFIPGTYIKYEDFIKKNEELVSQKKKKAEGKRMALGLTTIAKETDSWLSAASFQEMIRVMVGASLRGAVDNLTDLKSNVIIGRLLPIGENYRNMHGY
ncbi:DNA-directed RNA polymerase subunit beta' [candidate division SR1 bacterium]|nr:DNA-directed RNA polymerase subunit beta' [candidate division SR1 bacterium]